MLVVNHVPRAEAWSEPEPAAQRRGACGPEPASKTAHISIKTEEKTGKPTHARPGSLCVASSLIKFDFVSFFPLGFAAAHVLAPNTVCIVGSIVVGLQLDPGQ